MLTHPSLSSVVTCRLTSGDEKLVWMDHKADYDVNKKTIKVNSKSLSGPSGYGRRLEFKTVVSSNPVTGYWMDVIFHINWIVFFLKRQKLFLFRYMHAHYAYYIREMKIKAYAQLLESYRSLTLEYMAEAFGVTEDYMDGELSR